MPLTRFAIALVELLDEVRAQQRNVFGALAQRRHAHGDGVDPEIQILAQPPVAQRRVEIDVGRADQPEVDLDHPLAADRPVLALLQHAQQLGLQKRRHLADLVEHQRAAAGQLQQTRPCPAIAPVNAPFL